MRITRPQPRARKPRRLQLLPQLWFRNTWSWKQGGAKPQPEPGGEAVDPRQHAELGDVSPLLRRRAGAAVHRERNQRPRLWGQPNASTLVKDAFHHYVVEGDAGAVNPAAHGHQGGRLLHPGRAGRRLSRSCACVCRPPRSTSRFDGFDADGGERVWPRPTSSTSASSRRRCSEDERRVQRQALAGMIWSKQFYYYDVTHG